MYAERDIREIISMLPDESDKDFFSENEIRAKVVETVLYKMLVMINKESRVGLKDEMKGNIYS
jgi:hypothetical protein